MPVTPNNAVKQETVNLNGSAIRVLMLLQWLNEDPLSTEALNVKFKAHPLINKTLSTDSIWLYINTLKALGCDIERPKPSNEFKYVLKKHPYGIYLKNRDITRLAQIKKWTEKKISPAEWLNFSRFFKNTLDYVWLQEKKAQETNPNALMLEDSHSLDYEAYEHVTLLLQEAISTEALVTVRYQSPVKGTETFDFLPCRCTTKNGALYIHGYQEKRDALVQLRVDRLLSVENVEKEAVRENLLKKASDLPLITLFVLTDDAELYPELDGEVARQSRVKSQLKGLEIQLKTRDYFSLRQQLLSAGCLFQVIKPSALKTELQKQLKQMMSYYGDKANA